MKPTTIITLFFLLASGIVSGSAHANSSDDTEWVAKCMLDNKSEGQSSEVVLKYCKCMNDKMSEDEIQSITQWEKKHPKEEKECEVEAGWK